MLGVGDIVAGPRGKMGRCGIGAEGENRWRCGAGSLILRHSDSVRTDCLALPVGPTAVWENIRGSSVGTTMRNLNQGILPVLGKGLLPRSEQRQIVVMAHGLMASCDRLKADIHTLDGLRSHLLESLVHQARTCVSTDEG